MPIHPIGEKNRKIPEGSTSSLGSYYSVKDYKGVNPEYGTEEDFRNLVAKAHEKGFKVIIDWVPNHSAWDNPWITEHPDWYVKDSTGKFLAPFDWTDVVKLNYKNPEMRLAMIDAMKYWLEKCNIDGFRCDVAGEVPGDFWEQARPELEKVKPVFMLAENEDHPEYCNKGFDANYGWSMHATMHKVAQGKDSVNSIAKLVIKMDTLMPKNAFQMNFITNHDENSWNGTAQEKFGAGENAFAVLTYTIPGMPLIYSGQEAGLNHRLQFFLKDSINWKQADFSPFYKTLNALKHSNPAIWNPPYGGSFEMVNNSLPAKVISFVRQRDDARVIVIANLSAENVTVNLKKNKLSGTYNDVFAGKEFQLGDEDIALQPWGYLVLDKK
jgi:glycosidase